MAFNLIGSLEEPIISGQQIVGLGKGYWMVIFSSKMGNKLKFGNKKNCLSSTTYISSKLKPMIALSFSSKNSIWETILLIKFDDKTWENWCFPDQADNGWILLLLK